MRSEEEIKARIQYLNNKVETMDCVGDDDWREFYIEEKNALEWVLEEY